MIKRKDIEPKTISLRYSNMLNGRGKIWASLLVKAGLLPFQNSHLAGESKFAIRSLKLHEIKLPGGSWMRPYGFVDLNCRDTALF